MRTAKRLLSVLLLLTAAAIVLFLGIAFFLAQRADYGWRPRVGRPTYVATHPMVLFDEGHNNGSKAGFTGRYWDFARLLRADGCRLTRCSSRKFTPDLLRTAQVLVVANAAGAPKRQIFGINIPQDTGGRRRGDPAFEREEIEDVRRWVEKGGSLLLIADHAPFGQAAAALASAFGITMHMGFVEVPGERSDPLVFSLANGRLGDHPILRGNSAETRVKLVMTYTGQSLGGPKDATVLLRLPTNATESVPDDEKFAERPAGPAQGLALEYGKGRLVVLGEAAMLTSQVDHRVPYGMDTGGNDNRRLALNIIHWLLHTL